MHIYAEDSAILRSLETLQCPISHLPLSFLSGADVAEVNREAKTLDRRHRGGAHVLGALTSAVGTENRRFVYRVEEDILWLLPELALVRDADLAAFALSPEKRTVQSFYDEFGWIKGPEGLFNDTATFTDVRSISRSYQRACNARVGRQLGGGRFLLDVASGAIPHPEYLEFSDAYETRICVDFSIRALREAKRQLGPRGLYVLGDIVALPIVEGAMDDVISLHTIYHLPPEEQATAVDEVVRVTKAGGKAVIVYVWSRSIAMDAIFSLRKWLGRLRCLARLSRNEAAGPREEREVPSLYFRPQDYAWFVREVLRRHPAKLRVWSAVSSTFQTRFVPPGRSGLAVNGLIRLFEDAMPWLAGRIGMYPMFIIDGPERQGRG